MRAIPRVWRGGGALAVSAAIGALAWAAPASAQNVSIPFTKSTLPNGLVVILSEDHAVPQVGGERLVPRRARAWSAPGGPGSRTSSST